MIYHREDSILAIREQEALEQEREQQAKMLPLQLQAATDRQDFLEDCIAEMAMQVYAE